MEYNSLSPEELLKYLKKSVKATRDDLYGGKIQVPLEVAEELISALDEVHFNQGEHLEKSDSK